MSKSRQARRGDRWVALTVIVSVKRRRKIRTNTRTYHEHGFEQSD
jgi:hypothetical protein